MSMLVSRRWHNSSFYLIKENNKSSCCVHLLAVRTALKKCCFYLLMFIFHVSLMSHVGCGLVPSTKQRFVLNKFCWLRLHFFSHFPQMFVLLPWVRRLFSEMVPFCFLSLKVKCNPVSALGILKIELFLYDFPVSGLKQLPSETE